MGRRKPIKSVKKLNKVEYLATASLDFFQTTSLDKDHLVLSPIQRFRSTFFNTEPKYRNNPPKIRKRNDPIFIEEDLIEWIIHPCKRVNKSNNTTKT